jgi:glycine betaine catabolism A
MGAERSAVRRDPGYKGLTSAVAGLPASYYFDPTHHARELTQIWYQNWVYVCRSSELTLPRAYRTFELGDQSIFLVRDEDGALRAFHNTCRHRGSVLCRTAQGRFPATGIVCPYHAWRYSLGGELLQTSSRQPPDGFNLRDFPLYPVAVKDWNGFLFICLAPTPPPFGASFDEPLERMADWQLPQLVVGHALSKSIACNWKIFWENYNECLHCPGVHPRLAQLVPLFGRAYLDERDDPSWQDHADDADPKYRGGLRTGADSWTMDGRPVGVPFPKLSAVDRRAGHIYMTCLPSVFIVGHVDYVRIVRLRPLGPEATELSIEFLFLPETLADPGRNIMSAVEFTDIVMSEDAAVCELNQRGLHARPHEHGVVMPEEYVFLGLHEWIKSQLTRT